MITIGPLSRGVISINTTDPTMPPTYDFGTFSHPTDLEVAVESLKKVREWMASEPMQEVGPMETYPGTNVSTSSEISEAIRNFATSSWQHPQASCSMMKRELGGVVDSRLSVYGLNGLRIVDASIFPMAVGGHTSATVYAVAEKASLDLFLKTACVLANVSSTGCGHHQGRSEMRPDRRTILALMLQRPHVGVLCKPLLGTEDEVAESGRMMLSPIFNCSSGGI